MSEKKEYQVTDVAGKLAKGFLRNPTPKEIENVIVKPLERKLREVRGIEHVYGMAMDNVGVVNVMYYIGEDREDSNLKLYDKVMQNMDLMPKGVMQPLIKPFDIDIDIPIITVAFYPKPGSNLDDVKLFEMVRKVQQKINGVDYVAKTTLKGARKAQYNIEVDMGKLSAYHLSLGQIMQAVQSVAVDVPDVKGRTRDNKLVVFGVKNAIESVDDVGSVIVAQYMGSPIYLRDVAQVRSGLDIQNFQTAKILLKEDANTSALSEELNQITMTVAKLAGTNAVFVAEDVVDVLKAYEAEFSKVGITIIIIALMLVFALGWRESLIVTFSVPAILAVTLFTAWMTGQTMNRITLFALLLSLGLLVDAAIIVIENIHRHLHSHGVEDKEMGELLIEATDEIGAPTNIATLAIILTMVPMAFVGGMMGSFMKPIPYNVPVALIASLFVAYIFTPYLSLRLLKKPEHKHHHHDDRGGK